MYYLFTTTDSKKILKNKIVYFATLCEHVMDVNQNVIFFRHTDNKRAQDVLNLMFYHWGLHSWIVYVIVGLTMAFVSYRMSM